MNESSSSSEPSNASRTKWIVLLGAIVLLGTTYYFAKDSIQSGLESFKELVQSYGRWGPAVFIAGYAVLAVALIPGSVLTLGAGAIFGLSYGVVYVMAGASLGAAGGFLVARYFARGYVERRIQENPRFAAIDRAIGRDGLKITALLRLSPVFPFNFLNYALGLTKVPFLHYNLASIAMIPGTFLYVYYGSLAGDAASAQGDVWSWVQKGVGLVATIIVTAIITRTARRALKEATADDPNDAAAR